MSTIDRTHQAKRAVAQLSSGSGVPLALAVLAGLVAGYVVSHTVQDRYGPTLLLGLLVPLLSLRGSRVWVAIGAAAGAWVLVVAYMTYVPRVIDPAPVVSQAVGQAAWYGTPYVGPQIAAVGIAATLVAIALALVIRHRRRGGAAVAARAADRGGGAGGALIVVAAVAIVAFTLIPDPAAYFRPNSVPPTWDGANFLTWDGLIGQGLIPMKDFFYPYGAQWIYDIVPEGPLLKWLVEAATLALAGWALWRPSGRRPWRVALCLVAVPVLAGLNPLILWRYLPALLIPATYAALGPARHSRPSRAHLPFAAACLLAFLLEPDLLLYGLAGMAMVLVGEFVSGALAWRPVSLLRGLAVDLLPVLAALAVVVLGWVAIGAVQGNLRFYLGLRAVSAAAAIDPHAGALYLLSLKPSIWVIYLAAPALLLVAGLVRASQGPAREQNVAPLLLAAGGLDFVFLLKHLSRNVADTMLVIPMLVLVWVAILLWDGRRLSSTVAAGAFAGAILVTVQNVQGVTHYLRGAINSPAHAVDAALLPARAGEVRRDANARFALANLPHWPDKTAVRLYRGVVGPGPVPNFWVLGDAQLLYAIFDRRPPYQISPYDSSPIDEQRAVLKRVRQSRPPYMIWSREVLKYADAVPLAIRTPLLYEYAVRNYVPVRHSVAYDVLRRRRPGEPVPAGYWQRNLGRSLKLLYVPSYSTALAAPSCHGGPDCAEYVVARSDSPVDGQSVKLGFKVGRRTFWAIFRARSGVDAYPVRLDRLWFWPMLKARPKVRVATPGWNAHLAQLRDADSLY